MRPSLAFPLLALAVHAAGACALRSTYLEAFGRGATLPSGSEITLTYAILIATAPKAEVRENSFTGRSITFRSRDSLLITSKRMR